MHSKNIFFQSTLREQKKQNWIFNFKMWYCYKVYIPLFFTSMLGIRWHSRAGHGAITAANALCEIIAANTDYNAQSFPDFGAEKKGAPVVVFNRFSTEKILETYHVQHPDIVLLLDTSLINPSELSYDDILEGIKPEASLLLNTKQEKTQFSEKFHGTVYHLDATTISVEAIGRNIPNVPMLGALLKISGLSSLETFSEPLRKYLLQALPEKIVDGNIEALQKGYKEVKLVEG